MIFVIKFGSGGVMSVVWYAVGGYMNLFHSLLPLTSELCGVSGTLSRWYYRICRFSSMILIVLISWSVQIL